MKHELEGRLARQWYPPEVPLYHASGISPGVTFCHTSGISPGSTFCHASGMMVSHLG